MKRLTAYLLLILIFHIATELFSYFYLTDVFSIELARMLGSSPLAVWSIVQIIAVLFIFLLLFITKPLLLRFGYFICGIILIFELSHFFEHGSFAVMLSASFLILFGIFYWIKLIPYLRTKIK
ncbi:MAG: hypothetical protein ACI9P5_004688 [Saprospiraceae bacterium]|jgi:hypothetical protein